MILLIKCINNMNNFKIISLVLLVFLFNCVNFLDEDECFEAITSYEYAEIDIINKSQNVKFIKFKSGNSFNINLHLLDFSKSREDVVKKTS